MKNAVNQNGSFIPAGRPHAFGQLTHFSLCAVGCFALCVLDCGEDEVFDDFLVVAVEDGRIDVEGLQLAFGGTRRLNQACAGFPDHRDVVHLFLHLGHLRLHFLGFFHHPGHIAEPA